MPFTELHIAILRATSNWRQNPRFKPHPLDFQSKSLPVLFFKLDHVNWAQILSHLHWEDVGRWGGGGGAHTYRIQSFQLVPPALPGGGQPWRRREGILFNGRIRLPISTYTGHTKKPGILLRAKAQVWCLFTLLYGNAIYYTHSAISLVNLQSYNHYYLECPSPQIAPFCSVVTTPQAGPAFSSSRSTWLELYNTIFCDSFGMCLRFMEHLTAEWVTLQYTDTSHFASVGPLGEYCCCLVALEWYCLVNIRVHLCVDMVSLGQKRGINDRCHGDCSAFCVVGKLLSKMVVPARHSSAHS